MTGMAIRELPTSAKLAMPFTNVREWSGPLVNGDGSWVAQNRNNSSHDSTSRAGATTKLFSMT